MSTETSNSNDNNNNLNLLNCNETTTSNTSATDPDRSNIDLATIDTFGPDKFPSQNVLCSLEVARQSRELVDEVLDELGNNLDQAVALVNDYLENPLMPDAAVFTSSIHAMKNRRESMEDRHIIIHNLNKALGLNLPKTYSYYGIFDGHAGVDAASYSSAHLHRYLVESKAFLEGRMEDAFREAFEKTDSLYIKRLNEDGLEKMKASGTTALCALIEDNKNVYLAWAGDSQAVLVRNGCHEDIMLPHKPNTESERIRIQEQGGMIIYMDTWRVNGILSVSRAIGDPDHKALIIAEPSCSSFEIDSSLDFLVLGCDGLFDYLTGQDIASHVFEYLCKNENNDPEQVINGVSEYLSKMAIMEGSSDNITSIVIFFKPFEQLVSTGFPGTIENQEPIDNSLYETPTKLSTTNGGHFPYTDFAELPIGKNYKLTANNNHNLPNEMDDFINQPETNESFLNVDDLTNVQSDNITGPMDDNMVVSDDDDDLGEDERCKDEFDFVRCSDIEQQQQQQLGEQTSQQQQRPEQEQEQLAKVLETPSTVQVTTGNSVDKLDAIMETVNHNNNNNNNNNENNVTVTHDDVVVAATNVLSPESANSTPIEQCLNVNDHSENFTNVIDNQFETNKANLENISDSNDLTKTTTTTTTMPVFNENTNNLSMDLPILNSETSIAEQQPQPISSFGDFKPIVLNEADYHQQSTMNDLCFDNTINTAYPAPENVDNLMMSMLNHSQFCNQNGSIAADQTKPNDNDQLLDIQPDKDMTNDNNIDVNNDQTANAMDYIKEMGQNNLNPFMNENQNLTGIEDNLINNVTNEPAFGTSVPVMDNFVDESLMINNVDQLNVDLIQNLPKTNVLDNNDQPLLNGSLPEKIDLIPEPKLVESVSNFNDELVVNNSAIDLQLSNKPCDNKLDDYCQNKFVEPINQFKESIPDLVPKEENFNNLINNQNDEKLFSSKDIESTVPVENIEPLVNQVNDNVNKMFAQPIVDNLDKLDQSVAELDMESEPKNETVESELKQQSVESEMPVSEMPETEEKPKDAVEPAVETVKDVKPKSTLLDKVPVTKALNATGKLSKSSLVTKTSVAPKVSATKTTTTTTAKLAPKSTATKAPLASKTGTATSTTAKTLTKPSTATRSTVPSRITTKPTTATSTVGTKLKSTSQIETKKPTTTATTANRPSTTVNRASASTSRLTATTRPLTSNPVKTSATKSTTVPKTTIPSSTVPKKTTTLPAKKPVTSLATTKPTATTKTTIPLKKPTTTSTSTVTSRVGSIRPSTATTSGTKTVNKPAATASATNLKLTKTSTKPIGISSKKTPDSKTSETKKTIIGNKLNGTAAAAASSTPASTSSTSTPIAASPSVASAERRASSTLKRTNGINMNSLKQELEDAAMNELKAVAAAAAAAVTGQNNLLN